jgi:AraC-like DNA-binding protein
MPDGLSLPAYAGLRAQNGGRFVSRGRGSHPARVIDSNELIFVTSGTLHLTEEDTRFDLSAGDALLLWPGRRHAGAAPYGPDTAFYWVHFEMTGHDGTLTVPQTARVARPDVLTGLFRRFLDDQESGLLDAKAAAHLVALMLREVALAPPQGAAGDGRAAVLAHHARTHVVTHLSDAGLSASAVARALDCHPDHLGRCFRAAFGHTLTEEIHRQRLRRARALLIGGNGTVEWVARECGFPGVTFFRRVFRRHEGMTPSDYRRLHARVHVNTD